jgi:hypothetical protein
MQKSSLTFLASQEIGPSHQWPTTFLTCHLCTKTMLALDHVITLDTCATQLVYMFKFASYAAAGTITHLTHRHPYVKNINYSQLLLSLSKY